MPSAPPLVVVTFGPRARTRAALRRLRGVARGATVLTTPGIPTGDDGSGGRAGLVTALAALPPGPVVVVHEDVVVTSPGLARLVAAVERGAARYAVPVLDDHPGDARVRLVCVAGRRDDLVALTAHRIHDPLTVLDDLAGEVTVVGGAAVPHDDAGIGRLRALGAPAAGGRRPLVAALIVRDEERNLPDCLASLTGVVDGVVVCDTGSTDRTVALARAAGARVIERPWRDDFGWARNEALVAAGDADWVLSIDADERLRCDDPALLRGHLAAFAPELEAAEVDVANLSSGTDAETTRFGATRLLRPDRCRFEGALHEQVVRRDGTLPEVSRTGLCHLDHLGYRAGARSERGKAERNLAVAEAAHERSPSAKTALDLARSLRLAGHDPDRTAALLRHALATTVDTRPTSEAFVRSQLATVLLEGLRRPDEAVAEASAALRLVPAEPAARLVLARALGAAGRHHELVTTLADADARPSPAPVARSVPADAETAALLARSLLHLGRADDAWAAMAAALAAAGPSLSDEHLPVAVELAGPDPTRATLVLAGVGGADRCDAAAGLMAHRVRPADLAVVLADHVARGGPGRSLVTVGLLAAAVAGVPEAVDRLVVHGADRLDPAQVGPVADRLRARGLPTLADRLAPPHPRPVTTVT